MPTKTGQQLVVVMPLGRSGSFLVHGVLLQQEWSYGPECCIDISDLDLILKSDSTKVVSEVCRDRYSKENNIWYYDLPAILNSELIFPANRNHEKCRCNANESSRVCILQIHQVLMSGKAAKSFFDTYRDRAIELKLLVTTRQWNDNIRSCHAANPYRGVPESISILLWALKFYRVWRILNNNLNRDFDVEYVSLENLHGQGYDYLEKSLFPTNPESAHLVKRRNGFTFRDKEWKAGVQEGNPVGPHNLIKLRKPQCKGFSGSIIRYLNPENNASNLRVIIYLISLVGTAIIIYLSALWLAFRRQTSCSVCSDKAIVHSSRQRNLRHRWHEMRRLFNYINQL